jgi:cell division protein FtsQ
LSIVEQDPPDDPDHGPDHDPDHDRDPDAADAPAAPRLIRIDDLSGSVPVEPAEPTPPSLADAADAVDTDATPDQPTNETPRIIVIGDATPLAAHDEPPAASAVGPATDGVISIADDDLPDAVYVKGSLDGGGDGSIVIIEDDDTGDTLAPDAERDLRRGIEPRMRERRVQVKRSQGRRRLIRLAVGLGVVLVVVGTLAVLGSSLFAVRAEDVRVFGAVYTDREVLSEIVDDAVGTPVLRLDTGDLTDRIEAIPWVESATVRTDFPHGLTIDIRERAAMTTYQGPDQRFRVLDREGRVLDVIDKYPFAYVLIGGPDPVDLAPGEFAPRGYVAASELAKNLTGSVRGRVTMIEVTSDGARLVMHLDDGTRVFFGEARDLLAKLVRLEAVLANGQEREPGLVDVSTADVTR